MITDFTEAMKAIKGVFDKSGKEWVEVSPNIANQMLECLPPAYWKGDKFATGEIYSHKGGKAVFYCFRKIYAKTAEGRICTIDELAKE
jgi:hypothetical protein